MLRTLRCVRGRQAVIAAWGWRWTFEQWAACLGGAVYGAPGLGLLIEGRYALGAVLLGVGLFLRHMILDRVPPRGPTPRL